MVADDVFFFIGTNCKYCILINWTKDPNVQTACNDFIDNLKMSRRGDKFLNFPLVFFSHDSI